MLTRSIVLLLTGAMGIEATARFGLGLGTPPLSIEHPTIDYMFAPNQNVRRFGNHQHYNAQGMRSARLALLEGRDLVLVFGDSVLNGGSLSDQADIATTLATDSTVFYGNVSAGSWGPGNHRAWMDTFGLLGAKAVIFLYSSHDLMDQPEFKPLNPNTHPQAAPWFASEELIRRYLPRYIPTAIGNILRYRPDDKVRPRLEQQRSGREDLETMFGRLRDEGVPACIIFHPSRPEIFDGLESEKQTYLELAGMWNLTLIDLTSIYLAENNTAEIYRDDIHITDLGQKRLLQALRGCRSRARIPFTEISEKQ